MSETTAIRFGPFCLMGRYGPLLRDNREIKLQRKALAVLWTLASQPGEAVTRSALMDAVWPGAIVIDDVLSFQIKALRRAIEDDPKNPRYILTAHRIGFRLMAEQQPVLGAPASKLVGRQAHLELLRELHDRAGGGQRQFAFVLGEAGIGKSALIDEFLRRLSAEAPSTARWWGGCLEAMGDSEAYQPIYGALDQAARGPQGEEVLDLLRRNAPSWLRQLSQLLSREEVEELRRITSGTPQDRLGRELAEALEAFSATRTLVLIIEDLHWSDASTVALLGLLARRETSARLLVICSCRPVETILDQHPARALQLSLTARGRARSLFVEPLPPEDGRTLIRRRLPDASPELGEEILRRSGGHPLFLIHLAEYLAGQGIEAATELAANRAVPPRLRELIELQLSQLSMGEQLLLEVGAVAGQEFAAALVAAGSGLALESVEVALESLAQRRLFIADHALEIWPDGTVSGRFQFRHALYGQVLGQRIARSRKARLHRRLAGRLESAYASRSAEVATNLAYHYEAGGVAAKAAEYCVLTAKNALDRFAPHEASAQVSRGLSLLVSLAPDLPRHRIELRLRVLASQSSQYAQGMIATGGDDHRDRIDTLMDWVGDDPSLVHAFQVQWLSRHFGMQSDQAIQLGERLRDLGRRTGQRGVECAGLGLASHSLHIQGRHELADHYAADAWQLFNAGPGLPPQEIMDANLIGLTVNPLVRWTVGFPIQALAMADQICRHIERHGNPYLTCSLPNFARGMLLELTGRHAELIRQAEASLELARRCGHLEGQYWARILLGISQCRIGDPQVGLTMLRELIDEMRLRGIVIQVPLSLIHIARVWSGLGQHERALSAVDEALVIIRQSGHRPWEPEVLRTLGELQWAASPRAGTAATVPVWEALELARVRKALSLELRAATSLARMLRALGREEEALSQLQPVLAKFSEGHELPDLLEASALIASIRG